MTSKKPQPIELRPSRRRLMSRWQRERRRQRTALVVGAIALLIILAIPAYGYYTNFVAPPRQWVVKVNDTTFTLGYLVKLLRMQQRALAQSGGNINLGTQPFQLIQVLAENELIRQAAPRYGITVTPEEVDKEVHRRIMGGDTGDSSTPPEQLEREFRERYRQYLDAVRLSDRDYRQIVMYELYRDKMRELLGQQVPTVLPQVHLFGIVLNDRSKLEEVQQRFSQGVPFEELARQYSSDPSAEKGGDMGWLPKGVRPELDDIIFSLEPGQLSDPVNRPDGTVALYLVKEKAEARPVDQKQREVLKTRALEKWLAEEQKSQDVRVNFNSDLYAWVVKQLRLSAPPSQPSGQSS